MNCTMALGARDSIRAITPCAFLAVYPASSVQMSTILRSNYAFSAKYGLVRFRTYSSVVCVGNFNVSVFSSVP
jgi:hypothetical protein